MVNTRLGCIQLSEHELLHINKVLPVTSEEWDEHGISTSRNCQYNCTQQSRECTHLRPGNPLHFVDDFGSFFWSVQIRHVTGVQDHTDVLHERLVLDLVVRKQEDSLLSFCSSFQQQLQKANFPV